jgi:hypothetical protein
MNKIPLKAFAPQSRDAPGNNLHFEHRFQKQLSFLKQNLTVEELSIPSTNCIKRVLATVANPRVLTDLKDKLLVFICTSFKFSKPS